MDLTTIAAEDVKVLEEKGRTYGDSWRKRGGMGAFMMLARKFDRIENQAQDHGYDLFLALDADVRNTDGLLDDIADLRRYLLLVENHFREAQGAGERAATYCIQTGRQRSPVNTHREPSYAEIRMGMGMTPCSGPSDYAPVGGCTSALPTPVELPYWQQEPSGLCPNHSGGLHAFSSIYKHGKDGRMHEIYKCDWCQEEIAKT